MTAFWTAVGERAAKTFAQVELAALTAASGPVDIIHTDWLGVLSLGLGAAVLSVLTSLASLGDNTPGKQTSTTPVP